MSVYRFILKEDTMKRIHVIRRKVSMILISLLLCFLFLMDQAQATVQVITQMTQMEGHPVGEIYVNNQLVMRMRTEASGLSVKERTEIVSERLAALLTNTEIYDTIVPAQIEEEIVVRMGEHLIVTVDKGVADLNDSYQQGLAWVWVNNIRAALGVSELAKNPLAFLDVNPCQETNLEALKKVAYAFSGKASWYGDRFHGRCTASGEAFNQYALTAAHRSLPFGTRLRVTNVKNGKAVIVKVNDRGPFVGNRILDLSKEAASRLNMLMSGIAKVQVEVLK